MLNASSLAYAAEDTPAASTQTNKSQTNTSQTTPATNTPSKPTTKRIQPNPEKSRIEALEDTLKQNHLAHQINTLQAAGSSFLTLYRNALSGDTQGCAILLQSDNEHPNWPTVISPLRNTLPKYSWCTLSIELPDITKRAEAVKTTPVIANNADNTIELPNQDMVFARIQAAIEDLKNKGNDKQIILIGYGTGASYALHFLAQNKTLGDALILIDIIAPDTIPDYNLAQDLSLIEQPVLDYYLNDSPQSLRFATWRKQASNQKKGDTGVFTQLAATDIANSPTEDTQQVIQRVRGFLKQNTTQVEQLKPLPEYKKGLFYESP